MLYILVILYVSLVLFVLKSSILFMGSQRGLFFMCREVGFDMVVVAVLDVKGFLVFSISIRDCLRCIEL